MKPTMGRIVVYWSIYDGPLPAMVVRAFEDGTCNLSVFTYNPQQPVMVQNFVTEAEAPGCWSWPVREGA